MAKTMKPSVKAGVADKYASAGERIVEFTTPSGRGGLICIRDHDTRTLVDVYRTDAGVEVRGGKEEIPTYRDVPQIETAEWEKNEQGYLRRARGRTVWDVARDLEKAIEGAGLSYEYVSPLASVTEIGKWAQATEWPEGETFVSLEMGGNEGYAVMVYVRGKWTLCQPEEGKRTNWSEAKLYNPIRVKLLTTHEDAIRVHALAFRVLGS